MIIQLYRAQDAWFARFTGMGSEDIRRLFATDTLPTAYTAQASSEVVCAAVQAGHPDAQVMVLPDRTIVRTYRIGH